MYFSRTSPSEQLAERERKRFNARAEKLDLEVSIDDWLGLTYQLVQTLFGNGAVALLIDVYSMGRAGRLSIDPHAKLNRLSGDCWAHDQVKVARVKAIGDGAVGLVQRHRIVTHRPIAGQCPFIRPQPFGRLIGAVFIQTVPPGDAKF